MAKCPKCGKSIQTEQAYNFHVKHCKGKEPPPKQEKREVHKS